MKNKLTIGILFAALLGGTPTTSYAKAKPPASVQKIVPSGCKINTGNNRDGYSLQCKIILPNKLPKWAYQGIDLIPIDDEEFIERRTWTHTSGNDEWYLVETVRCNSKRCFDPKIRLFFGDHCGAP